MTGDLLQNYEDLALRDDLRRRQLNSRAERGIPTAVKLADSDPSIPLETHLDLAVHNAQNRFRSLGVARESVPQLVERGCGYIHRVESFCESPIERLMLPWLVFEDYGPFLTFPVPCLHPKQDDMPPKGDLIIVPQFAFVRFRLDFAIIATWKGATKIVAVELDGAAFHQPDRDKRRDAYLAGLGVTTIRARGSDVVHQPRTVSARVAEELIGWAAQ